VLPARATSDGARKVCCSTERATFRLRGRVALSIPATASTRFPQKNSAYIQLPTQAGAHHTSCAHRRLPLPLSLSPSSWPSSPSPVDSQERTGLHEKWRKLGYEPSRGSGDVGRMVLPTCECARAACARLDLGERAEGNTSHAPRADVPCHAGCTARGYQHRGDMLGGVVARARRRVPRHRQGGLPCKSCWYLKNAVGNGVTSERGHQS
jgi:hypothetical protein